MLLAPIPEGNFGRRRQNAQDCGNAVLKTAHSGRSLPASSSACDPPGCGQIKLRANAATVNTGPKSPAPKNFPEFPEDLLLNRRNQYFALARRTGVQRKPAPRQFIR